VCVCLSVYFCCFCPSILVVRSWILSRSRLYPSSCYNLIFHASLLHALVALLMCVCVDVVVATCSWISSFTSSIIHLRLLKDRSFLFWEKRGMAELDLRMVCCAVLCCASPIQFTRSLDNICFLPLLVSLLLCEEFRPVDNGFY
jgi:hypothetical protein